MYSKDITNKANRARFFPFGQYAISLPTRISRVFETDIRRSIKCV